MTKARLGATDYDALDQKRRLAIALKRAHKSALRECFDPKDVESRPTPAQDEILRETLNPYLFQYVKGGNQSGKTLTASRIVAWFFQGWHPYIDLQALWPDESLVILVCGRVINQIEEIWLRKIRPFLNDDEWRENRQGGTLQYVVNPKNGNKIIFCSHQNPAEAQEKLQSYSLHLAWLDELTDHLGVIEEMQRRVQERRGAMLITFTPKIRAPQVRKFLETPNPYAKLYGIHMLDNPSYAERKEEILAQISALPEAQRNTILYGDWYVGERCVFSYDASRHCKDFPPGYSTMWPHVVAVDPAASGLMGLSVWAAPDPNSFTWYCVKAKYLKGAAPTDLIFKVEEETQGYQVLWRICDTHEQWFVKEASKHKIHYRTVPHKRDRKKELIAQLNQALASGRVVLTPEADALAAELTSAQWSETNEDRIINASSYHVADTAQYFVDQIPRVVERRPEELTFDAQLSRANKLRKQNELARHKKEKQTFRIVAKRGRTWKRSA